MSSAVCSRDDCNCTEVRARRGSIWDGVYLRNGHLNDCMYERGGSGAHGPGPVRSRSGPATQGSPGTKYIDNNSQGASTVSTKQAALPTEAHSKKHTSPLPGFEPVCRGSRLMCSSSTNSLATGSNTQFPIRELFRDVIPAGSGLCVVSPHESPGTTSNNNYRRVASSGSKQYQPKQSLYLPGPGEGTLPQIFL